jgi:hypothetical protein
MTLPLAIRIATEQQDRQAHDLGLRPGPRRNSASRAGR